MRNVKLRLFLILTLALVLRVTFAWLYVAGHQRRALGIIPFLFEPGNIAFSLASGHGFSSPFRVETGPTAWMTPVYPLLLAGIFRVFGIYTFSAYLAAAGLNILFSTVTVIPLFFTARRVCGTGGAIVAATLWAIFPNAILLPYESLWDASLSALFGAVLLWATLAVSESRPRWQWALYGLVWGAALMTNAAFLSLLPFLFGWAEYRAHRKGVFSGMNAVLAAVVLILCCAPWTVRNYLVFHKFVPLRSVAGLALWLGNNDETQSTSAGRLHPISNQAEREKYVTMGEIEYMREKQSLAIDYIVSHPAAESRLIADRFIALWTGGSAHPVTDFRKARGWRFYLVIPANILIALGALTGLILLWRLRSPFAFPLTAAPVVFPLIYYFALSPPRYRHPIDPVLVLLTAFAFSHLPNYKKQPFPAHSTTP